MKVFLFTIFSLALFWNSPLRAASQCRRVFQLDGNSIQISLSQSVKKHYKLFKKDLEQRNNKLSSINTEREIKRFYLLQTLYAGVVSVTNAFKQKVPWPFLKDGTYQAASIIANPEYFRPASEDYQLAVKKFKEDLEEFNSLPNKIRLLTQVERLRQSRVLALREALSQPETLRAFSLGLRVDVELPVLIPHKKKTSTGSYARTLSQEVLSFSSELEIKKQILKEMGGVTFTALRRWISDKRHIKSYLWKSLLRQALLRWKLYVYHKHLLRSFVEGKIENEDNSFLKQVESALNSVDHRSTLAFMRVVFWEVFVQQLRYRFNKDFKMTETGAQLSRAINENQAFVEENIRFKAKTPNLLFKHIGRNILVYVTILTGSTSAIYQQDPMYFPDIKDYVLYQGNPNSISRQTKEDDFWRELGSYVAKKYDLKLLAGRLSVTEIDRVDKLEDLKGAIEDLRRTFLRRSEYYQAIPDKKKEYQRYLFFAERAQVLLDRMDQWQQNEENPESEGQILAHKKELMSLLLESGTELFDL